MKKFLRICLLILIGIIVYFAFGVYSSLICYYANVHQCKKELNAVTQCLEVYIEGHSGQFPSSEDDLVQAGIILRKKMPPFSKLVYKIPKYEFEEQSLGDPNNENWKISNYFEDFKIAYGAQISNLEAKNHKLHNKETGNQVLLINGPILRKKVYEKATWKLFQKMNNSKK